MKQLLFILFAVTANMAFAASPKAKHLILIGLDGWGAYSVEKMEMPAVRMLMEKGAYTVKKRSVLPSSSAVNWATMFMGAGPEIHGYTMWGSTTPEIPSRVIGRNGIFPTIFQLYRDANPKAEIGCLYEWGGIKYVVDTLSLSHHALAADYTNNPERLCRMATTYIKEKRPNLLAVIFDNPDHAGHAYGHDTPAYYEKLKELDGYVSLIVESVRQAGILDDTIFIITSDHGGIGNGHGGKTLLEMETPFIISGKNVKRGYCFDGVSMMQFDCASTMAEALGVKQPQVWIGRSVSQVFK